MTDRSAFAAALERLAESPQGLGLARRPAVLRNLPMAAAAWVAELVRRRSERPLLAIVPHESDAMAWIESAELVGAPAVYFSAPSLNPYQETEVSLQVRAVESQVLSLLATGRPAIVVCTPRALFRRLPRPAEFRASLLHVRVGGQCPPGPLRDHLGRWGFRRTDLVTEVGDFAVRGGVVDVFTPGVSDPVRIDLFGDEIESLRRFDPQTQRSSEQMQELTILPLSLYPADERSSAKLLQRLRGLASTSPGDEAMRSLQSLEDSGRFPGWENYLPILAEATVGLPDWLDEPVILVASPSAVATEIAHHKEQLSVDFMTRFQRGMLAVEPRSLEHDAATVEAWVGAPVFVIQDSPEDPSSDALDFGARITDLFHGQLPRFPREVETARSRGDRLLLVCPEEHRARMVSWCESVGLELGPHGVEIVEGELRRGFRLPPAGVVVFGERQLFPAAVPARPRERSRYGPFVSSLRDLRLGDFVVHVEHGIGQFVALRSLTGETDATDGLPPSLAVAKQGAGHTDVEVMELAYAGGKNLLLPLSRLDQIQRYSGIESVSPRLDRLGGSSWIRTKERIKRSMQRLASDLVRLYAERQLAEAPRMPPDSDLTAQFEASFDYEETEDQLTAIAAVKQDLEQSRPMDRLLCGDVGFGKTEVAMRAALKAVEGGYQVAVLAPTTILADQHLDTFQGRFAGYPVRIEMISRRRSPAEVRAIRKALASGDVDILIGTHRLLSRDVEVPKLGLLIVDEEQRFGVAQKERLRELKKNVHVLSMSATPVPRTLQLSLAGVRDLSTIESPPRDRMAVETAILPFATEAIREAIEFELERDGQIYFVYNRVEGIEQFGNFLRDIVPGLRLTIGHGQLEENELAARMHAFKHREHDLLLATTIIENGIDIPNVNTIIVQHAERFGLAQLYQLRGRVGRSDQLAYCYLLVPSDRALTEEAGQRLRALREFTELGAGFRVAARDLEIRGAGNLLGPEQSGHIAAVGLETYLKLLEETVQELQGVKVEEAPSVAIDLPVPMAIPEDFISDTNLRMEIYRRIASAETDDDDLLAELRDRFGPPPPQLYGLLSVAALKRVAEALRVQSIGLQGSKIHLRLRRDARIDVDRLVRLVSERGDLSFSPAGVLTVQRDPERDLAVQARQLLEELAGGDGS